VLRLLPLLLLLAVPVAAARAEDAAVPLRASLVACDVGEAVFRASMPDAPGASRLELRFALQERAVGDEEFAALRVPGWDRWERSEPGRAGYVLTRRVMGLREGAAYRAEVRFRWRAADGEVVRRARRVTTACRQP
jgi:hypothetical protein